MMEEGRSAWIYLEVTKRAFEDGIITDDEASILKVLADCLGIQPSQSQIYLGIARGDEQDDVEFPESVFENQPGDFALYQSALIAALEDDVITSDEWEMMNLLAEVMNIKDSEHTMIEDSIRNMNKSSKSGVPLIDRYVSMVRSKN